MKKGRKNDGIGPAVWLGLLLGFWKLLWGNTQGPPWSSYMQEVLLHCGTTAMAAPDYLKRKRFPKA